MDPRLGSLCLLGIPMMFWSNNFGPIKLEIAPYVGTDLLYSRHSLSTSKTWDSRLLKNVNNLFMYPEPYLRMDKIDICPGPIVFILMPKSVSKFILFIIPTVKTLYHSPIVQYIIIYHEVLITIPTHFKDPLMVIDEESRNTRASPTQIVREDFIRKLDKEYLTVNFNLNHVNFYPKHMLCKLVDTIWF
ncbi:hypothetical protein AGLY_005356 [Aphis glycines]|uniref:Uncharacterized protein n=1 Tax=Aphis glycines TaxID=307491 RepID=A0A6G0TWW3_APHGL|nr:hypothetical protein AGLY_005356 [Aphis glycines]